MPITEFIFDLVKKYPGYELTVGYNEKHDWHELYVRYGTKQIVKAIPSWLSEMYSITTVKRTIEIAFEELAAVVDREARGNNDR